MNKLNKLLFAFTFILILSFCNKVSANNAFGMLECKYKVGNYSDKIDSTLVKDGMLNFYYTDLEFGHDSIAGGVFIKDKSGKIYPLSQIGDKLPKLSSKYTLYNTSDNLQKTFIREIENSGDCPKYLVFATMQGSSDTYVPTFTKDATSYCSSNYDKCPVILQFDGAKSHVKKNTSSYNWDFKYNGDGLCDDLSVRIYVEDETKMKASITYPSDSPYRSNNTKGVLETPGVDGATQISYLYNLIINNKLDGYVYWDKNKKQIVLSSLAPSKSCNIGAIDDEDVEENHDCMGEDKLKEGVEPYKKKYDSFKKIITDSVNQNLYMQQSPYSKIDFSTYNSKEALSNSANNIGKSLDKLENSWSDFDNYNKYLTDVSKNLCSDSKKALDGYIDKFNSDKEELQKNIDTLTSALQVISTRLGKLGASSEKKAVDKYIEKAKKINTKLDDYSDIRKPTDDSKINLNYKKGCGIFSNEIKSWLIQVLDIIKVAALVLTLIFGMLDFFKGVASGNADAMKKMWNNFSKRLIAVIILFLLPVMIEFILGLVNISGIDASNPLCGIK